MNVKRIVSRIWSDFPRFNPTWKSNNELLNSKEHADLCFNFLKASENLPDWQQGSQYTKIKATDEIIRRYLCYSINSESIFVDRFARLILEERHKNKRRKY